MKLAVLDLGTNTFHLLIANVRRNKSQRPVFRSKVFVRLGDGMRNNRIADVPFGRGLKALEHYAEVLKEHKPERVFAFATSGIRSAANGEKFISEAKRRTGISIHVISGAREAELICFGVRQCVKMTAAKQLIMDIGGGSTEFIIADAKKIYWKKSFDIGASRLIQRIRPSDPVTEAEVKHLENFLNVTLKPLEAALKKYPVTSLIGSSGSFDTFAEMIGWRFYKRNPLKNVLAYEFKLADFFRLHEILLKSTTAQRMRMKGLIKMRVDMIVVAGICTNYILKRFRLSRMIVSKYALKEGAMWAVIHH